MDCLSETTAALFLDRSLPAGDARDVEAHMDGCPACRRLVSALARGAAPPVTDPEEAATEPAAPPRDGDAPAQVGRYRITGVLGTGGMGTVYAAHDPDLDRAIAVKLLRPRGLVDDEARARFAREAQALAQVSHPNVVAVHDVGTHGDHVFVAMERVAGGTLKAWLAAAPRTWREIVAIFVAAGRGLAAVHRHGLVHRDFKPDNVLVDGDRPRVSDFGLAAAAGDGTGERSEASLLDEPLTATGQVMGTPAYMAPEQFAGGAMDARTDLFSFCVALYEALYRERPFAGSTPRELADAVAAGALRPAPAGARVPGWLRAAVVRGLQAEPARRFPSVDALLVAIDRDPARVRRRWLGGVTLAAALAGGGWYWGGQRGGSAAACGGADQALAGAWDDARRTAIVEAFAATGGADAPAIATRVTGLLEAHAARWRASHDDSCRATRERRTQSERGLELRMACLAERKDELRALTDRLARIDPAMLDRALDAVLGLPAVGACDDLAALEQLVRPPAEPTARARVEATRASLATIRATIGLRPAHEVLAAIRPVVADAVTLDHPPLTAAAQLLLADALDRAGSFRDAEAAYRAAAAAADRGGDDRTRFEAWVGLIDMIAIGAGRPADVDDLIPLAEAALARARGDADLTERWQLSQASVMINRGQAREAAARFRELMTTIEQAHGPDDPRLATVAAGYAAALQRFGTPAEVESAARHARELRARAHGSGEAERRKAEIEAAEARLFEAIPLLDQGKPAEALAILEQARADLVRMSGQEHESVAAASEMIGHAHADLGQLDDARRDHDRALAIRRAVFGADSSQAAGSLVALSRIAHGQQDFSAAVDHANEALGIYLAKDGPDAPTAGGTHLTAARALQALGRLDEALPHATRAVAIGKDRAWYGGALTLLGDLQVARGELARGIVLLEQALVLRDATDWDTLGAAQTRLALARARVKQGRPADALALADRAALDFERLGKRPQADEARAIAATLR